MEDGAEDKCRICGSTDHDAWNHEGIMFERQCDRWQKRYGCTLGDDGGWCDGHNAKRCPSVIITGQEKDACELAL